MLFITQTLNTEDVNTVKNMFDELEEVNLGEVNSSDETSCISQCLNSFVTSYYQKSVEDIVNTKIGNRVTRKRNLSQVMKESFFYGANRFGTNFIA